MANELISLFGSSAYPSKLEDLVDSVNRSVPFEIVTCGPDKIFSRVREIRGVPYRHIYSELKPVQCSMSAATQTKGQYLLHIVDDIRFVSPDALSRLREEYNSFSLMHSVPVFLSTRLRRNEVDFAESNYYLDGLESAPVPVSLFCHRKFFFDLGGFDSSFITSMADADLVWRALDNHQAKFYLSSSIVEEKKDSRLLSLFDVYGKRDISNLRRLRGKKRIKKSFPLTSVSNAPIGPSGLWRFKSPLFRKALKTYHWFYHRVSLKIRAIAHYALGNH